jgi:hypothetical protein
VAVQDIQADVIESFHRPAALADQNRAETLKPSAAIETWLESTDDNHSFVDLVCAALRKNNPAHAAPLLTVPSLQSVPQLERDRYLAVPDIQWPQDERRALLSRMADSGCKIDAIEIDQAFRHVRLITLDAGEILIEAGQPAGMVYVPLGAGLRIIPLGGYDSFSVQAWMPLGSTGVIRGALRNAKVVAEQAVSTLMIPKDVYLRHWHATYTAAELQQRLGRAPAV